METSGTLYCLYMRFTKRSNWILQCRSDSENRHKEMIKMLKNDCLSNYANWTDNHPDFQIGEFVFDTDNIYLHSIDQLDNLKPNDTRIQIIYSHGDKEND